LAILANGVKPLLIKDAFKPTEFFDGHDRPRHGRDRDNGRERDRGRQDGPRGFEEAMETFRVEVGHINQVKAGNLVGAIANEAGISGSRIGRISIYEDYSTIDLPAGMPHAMFHELKKVRVAGQQLNISRPREELVDAAPAAPRPGEPKKATKTPKRDVARERTTKANV
jgi:ATP-dependent RNA helicase DeaD